MNTRTLFFQRRSVKALLLFLVLLAAVSFLPPAFLRPLQGMVAFVSEPFQGFFSWVAYEFRGTAHFITSVGELKRDNETLRRDKVQLEREVASLKEKGFENEALRRELKLPALPSVKSISGEVIGRDTNGLSLSLRINRGRLDGVESGMPVIVEGSVLIGRITHVHPSSAEVQLLSHPESTISGSIAGTSVQGVVRGDHGLGVMFDMASSDANLQNGDAVLSSGIGDGLPKGFLIGHLQDARLTVDRLFQQATLVAPVNATEVRFVNVLMQQSP